VAGPIFLALAVLVGVGSAALAWSQVRRTATLIKGDPAALSRALRRLPPKERVEEMRSRTEPGTWEHDLAEELRSISEESAQVAAVNAALSELERTLVEGADWPRSALRISLLGALLMAFGAYLVDPSQLRWALAIVATGGGAALLCVEAARAAKRNETRQRRVVDDLVAVVFGDRLPIAEPQKARNASAATDRSTRGSSRGASRGASRGSGGRRRP